MSELRVIDRDDRPYYTPAGLTKKLAISPSTLYKFFDERAIESYSVETQRRISPDAVDRFLGVEIDHADPRPCHSPASLANVLAVGRSTIYVMLEHRKLRSFKVGGQRRIAPEDVDRYLAPRTAQEAAA